MLIILATIYFKFNYKHIHRNYIALKNFYKEYRVISGAYLRFISKLCEKKQV